jgi:hypothetical protein
MLLVDLAPGELMKRKPSYLAESDHEETTPTAMRTCCENSAGAISRSASTTRIHEVEVAPIAREILAEARASGGIPDVIVKGDFRRLARKFIADRDRILTWATVELKWDLPAFHDRILRVLEELTALGVACDSRRIARRIDPKHAKPMN